MSRLTATLALLATVAFTTPAAAQTSPVAGTWSGNLDVSGMRLPLVFHILDTAGRLTATMDSPAQGARGIPVDTATFEGGEVVLRLNAIGGTYRGRLSGDTLRGTWTQGAQALPLTLQRGEAAAVELARPQHPRPPYPYREEHVRFPNARAGIELAGTLTLPATAAPYPAVILVSGSGPQDRDETLMGHKPFLVLADHLTRAGIAVLRYDDRGVGESGGDFASATTTDLAGDASAAIAFLRRHPQVDASRVGIIGHSEGGLIAPMVAVGAGVPRGDVAFTVLLAGPGLPGDEILRLQLAAISRASGVTPRQLETAAAQQARLLEVLKQEADTERRQARLRTVLLEGLAAMTPEERAEQGVAAGREEAWVDAQVASVGTPWFREFVITDPRTFLRQMRTPTLALFGELDLQVPPAENAAAMREAAAAAGNRDFTIVTLPRLNHLFQTATTGAPAEYATIEETFAPAALDAVTRWILDRTRPRVVK